MIDRFIYKFFAGLDFISEWINDKLFAPRCQCKKKKSNK